MAPHGAWGCGRIEFARNGFGGGLPASLERMAIPLVTSFGHRCVERGGEVGATKLFHISTGPSRKGLTVSCAFYTEADCLHKTLVCKQDNCDGSARYI